MNIQAILNDWKAGLTHSEIKEKHNLLDFEDFAITECSKDLTIEQITVRLPQLRHGDKGKQIRAIMQGVVK